MSLKFHDDFIWSLKYRPRTMDDIVLPAKLKNQFNKMIKAGKIGNVLLSGRAGTGKTTSAFILADAIDADTLYMNLSDETGIDGIRTKVKQFISTMSFDGKQKVFIGDECLEENEEIIVGNIKENKSLKLKDIPDNKEFDVVSMNRETGELENDTAEILFRKEEDVFLVELVDGRTVIVTKDHPFLTGIGDNYNEKTLEDGLSIGDTIIVK